MNNLIVYCEIEDGIIADVSLELLTKGRSLANQLNCKLEALVIGSNLDGVEKQVFPYGVDTVYTVDDPRLYPYTSLPHTSVLVNLFKEQKPQVCLMGATSIGRDLGPRVSSSLHSGLTADCTALEIGPHEDEIEDGIIADVSLELLTKGRSLANQLNCKLEALVIGSNLDGVEKQVFPYGVDTVYTVDDPRLYPYTSLPHTSVLVNLFKEQKPQVCLMGATSIGRDLGPRVSSSLHSGLTADCTALEIGPHEDKKNNKTYENLLYQIRPAFGGNIVATIVNPECRPQMATVREGVMKKEIYDPAYKGEVVKLDPKKYVSDTDFVVEVIDRQMEKSKANVKGASIIVAGGYGMGSKENFDMLFDLAATLGAEVGASRAAVDAGYIEHERQIGQTGVTVRPKLYIACGISGQIQHIAGMQDSSIIISINSDPNAPINTIADYVITGTVEEVIPKLIKYYKKNSK